MGRNKTALSLIRRAERESSISKAQHQSRRKKAMVKNRRTRRMSEILTINKVEVKSIKYQGSVISKTKDGTEKIKARILAANKVYSSLKTVFRSKQSQRNYKIR
jgi:hypothetical protein